MKIYGIKSCDTVRKAVKALDGDLHDIRAEPLAENEWQRFWDAFGEKLLNTRSTTWRGLDEAERARPPLQLLAEHPTLMKRPVIDRDGQLYLGWGKDVQAELLG